MSRIPVVVLTHSVDPSSPCSSPPTQRRRVRRTPSCLDDSECPSSRAPPTSRHLDSPAPSPAAIIAANHPLVGIRRSVMPATTLGASQIRERDLQVERQGPGD